MPDLVQTDALDSHGEKELPFADKLSLNEQSCNRLRSLSLGYAMSEAILLPLHLLPCMRTVRKPRTFCVQRLPGAEEQIEMKIYSRFTLSKLLVGLLLGR